MKKKIRILMIDDHPMIIWGYELSLKAYAEDYELEMAKAYDCDQALEILEKSRYNPFDVVLLDINLPVSKDGTITCGKGLGQVIKKLFPSIRIIVLTVLNDNYLLNNILRELDPCGFLIKSEITPEILFTAILSVLDNKTYYCQRINKLVRLNIINNEYADNLDREILYYISIGEKMKDLPKHIPLSIATIERRKKRMKILFEVSSGTDSQLLLKAKEKGVI